MIRFLYATILLFATACSLGDLVGGTDLPTNRQDPDAVKNREGALAAYRGALAVFATALAGNVDGLHVYRSYVFDAGMLSDELRAPVSQNEFPGTEVELLDSRRGETNKQTYGTLHYIRGTSIEARGALRKYAGELPLSYIGHTYALEGMAEVLLAELFCSGVPLSVPVFEGDYKPTAGYKTSDIFKHALALFDSAAKYAADSTRILHFVSVARGRALLSLGEYAQAATAVKDVPNDYIYTVSYSNRELKVIPKPGLVEVSNREGINGLPYLTVGDPRLALPELTDPLAPLIVASGIEARLIEAEAALHTSGASFESWLPKLNALRTTCTSATGCPSPAPAGTGGVSGLDVLTDPGTQPLPPGKSAQDAKIDLLFTERAYWLFLTGHRQGDLRRLVREYRREQSTVYPTGAWGARQGSPYGNDINTPVPQQERDTNPLYSGCFNRYE